MKIKRDIVQALAGASLMTVALQFGWLKPQGPFLTNLVTVFVIYGVSKIASLVLG